MSPAIITQPTTGCCGSPTHRCGTERTRFFPGQLVTPDDLTQDQDYFRHRMRRHNRLLHGWGIVCGAGVTKGTKGCEVTIASGFVLGPQGDEIVIDHDVTIDLCTTDVDGNAPSDCGPPADPWCSDVRVARTANATMYLAIRYAECDARPVRASGCGCGCSGGECEYSRIRDGFVVKALTALPASYAIMAAPNAAAAWSCAGGPKICPACPTEPWVILADVKIGADGASIATVTPGAHRRYVASFASHFYVCP